MSLRRPSFWVAYGLLCGFYVVSILIPSMDSASDLIRPGRIWPQAGHIVFMYNIFLPLLAGILAADRVQRDGRAGMRELQRGAPLSNRVYIFAKFAGVLLSVLLPMLVLILASGLALIALGLATPPILWPLLLAFVTIALPSHAFVVSFSMAFPMVLPLRVYQVLFTGYWFWGNMLNPRAFPTISDTLLNTIGQYPLQAFFGVIVDSTGPVQIGFSPAQAAANLAIVLTGALLALLGLVRYLDWLETRV